VAVVGAAVGAAVVGAMVGTAVGAAVGASVTSTQQMLVSASVSQVEVAQVNVCAFEGYCLPAGQ